MSKFDDEFAKIAKVMVEHATKKDTPFAEITDAFKALTAYYALRLKHKDGGDEPDGFNFGDGFGEESTNGAAVQRRGNS